MNVIVRLPICDMIKKNHNRQIPVPERRVNVFLTSVVWTCDTLENNLAVTHEFAKY